jgi:hypothetical protein
VTCISDSRNQYRNASPTPIHKKFWDDITDLEGRKLLMAAPPSNDGFGFGGEPAKNPEPTQNTTCSAVRAVQKTGP